MAKREATTAAVVTARGLVALGAAGLLAHAAPSALILPTMWRRQPERLGAWCRWRLRQDHAIALTFDDGPDVETLQTLDLLDDLGWRATFFVLGSQLQAHPRIAREILARGHEVGTHGFVHRHHLLSRPATISRDLDRAVTAHRELLGAPPRFFRAPYGQLTLPTLRAARRLGLENVLWSAWGKEWAEPEDLAVLRRLEAGLRPGAIVLLHDTDVSCRPGTGNRTRALLGPLAARVRERGLDVRALGELLTSARTPHPVRSEAA